MVVAEGFAARHALVGRSVRVRLRRDRTFLSGVLYGVDPESGDVALLQAPVSVKIILGHAVESVEPDANEATLASLKAELLNGNGTTSSTTATPDERVARTERLRAFLDVRFIPHAPSPEDPASSITVFGGAATLRFPFEPRQSVECANEQILLRLQSLLAAFQETPF